jgi:hypothetical protein
MLPKSAADLSEMAAAHGLKFKVTVLKNAREAQNAPSYYGVFSLLWKGRLLSVSELHENVPFGTR